MDALMTRRGGISRNAGTAWPSTIIKHDSRRARPVNKRALLQRAAENSRLECPKSGLWLGRTGSRQHSSETRQAPYFAPIRPNFGVEPLTKSGRKFERSIWLLKKGLNRKASLTGVSGPGCRSGFSVTFGVKISLNNGSLTRSGKQR
jgi:hypothetical protein